MHEFTKEIINEEIKRLEEILNNYDDEITYHTKQLQMFKKTYEDLEFKIKILKKDLE